MIVLDASAAVHYFGDSSDRWQWLTERIERESFVHVPAFFDLEVLQALRGLEAGAKLSESSLDRALTKLAELRAVYCDHSPLRARVWSLRKNMTAYDAVYVALAEALDSPLLTTDARLARSSGHRAVIEAPPT